MEDEEQAETTTTTDTTDEQQSVESSTVTEPTVTHRDFTEWHGRTLIDRNGQTIGKLEDVYFDIETDQAQFGTVKEGSWLVKRHLTFVPLADVTIGPDNLQLSVTKDQVKTPPASNSKATSSPNQTNQPSTTTTSSTTHRPQRPAVADSPAADDAARSSYLTHHSSVAIREERGASRQPGTRVGLNVDLRGSRWTTEARACRAASYQRDPRWQQTGALPSSLGLLRRRGRRERDDTDPPHQALPRTRPTNPDVLDYPLGWGSVSDQNGTEEAARADARRSRPAKGRGQPA